MYTKPPLDYRNTKGIEFEEIRKVIDTAFNACHDELSFCYYNQRPFIWNGRNYGQLTKETFDKLHGLIFDLREVRFNEENKKQPLEKQVWSKDYAERLAQIKNNIQELKRQNIDLSI